jgi:hypothetical protein
MDAFYLRFCYAGYPTGIPEKHLPFVPPTQCGDDMCHLHKTQPDFIARIQIIIAVTV